MRDSKSKPTFFKVADQNLTHYVFLALSVVHAMAKAKYGPQFTDKQFATFIKQLCQNEIGLTYPGGYSADVKFVISTACTTESDIKLVQMFRKQGITVMQSANEPTQATPLLDQVTIIHMTTEDFVAAQKDGFQQYASMLLSLDRLSGDGIMRELHIVYLEESSSAAKKYTAALQGEATRSVLTGEKRFTCQSHLVDSNISLGDLLAKVLPEEAAQTVIAAAR